MVHVIADLLGLFVCRLTICAQTWEQFMMAIEPISTQVAYMVGIGNHEYDYLAQPFRPWWSNYMGTYMPFVPPHTMCVATSRASRLA